MAGLTPFQTVGPYWSLGLRVALEPLPASYPGTRVVIRGRLLDGGRTGIPDGVLEWWHPGLPRLQRTPTAEDGSFALESIRPEAPHFGVRVLGRGILTQYFTRFYFPDDPHTASDAILQLVPEHRRHTLIGESTGANQYRFDVVVQGPDETVFFDFS